MIRVVAITFIILEVIYASENETHKDKVYYTREIIKSEGYPAESHHAVTKDGYILEMHRIPYGRNDTSDNDVTRPVVFLMHGLFGASNSFIFIGPEFSLAYLLADAGYDVWLGNARGTKNSRHHISLDPDKDTAKFFDFSFEEIALGDLPAMIDYILEETGQEQLHYIGHSQGGTVFFILNSMTTEYHDKIASAHLLAGVGYQKNFPNTVLKKLARKADTIYAGLRLAGNYEIFPPGSTSFDSNSNLIIAFARALGFEDQIDLIGGAAAKQVIHYGQNVRDKKFRRWDYGAIVNKIKYGLLSPPSYDLFKINVDVTLHYSLNDKLLSESDTLEMAKTIPNCKARKVARDTFTHLDYIVSKDSKELVIDYIIEALNNH